MENKKHFIYDKPAIVVYDDLLLEKGYCPDCHTTSSIRLGNFVCCDAPVMRDPERFYREPEAPRQRKTSLKPEKERILEEQEG
jgi:hypothetical protein